MQDSIIGKIVDFFSRRKSLDRDVNQTIDDIALLTEKIRIARNMFSDVLADKLTMQRDKLTMQRDKLLKKYAKLLKRRRHLFK